MSEFEKWSHDEYPNFDMAGEHFKIGIRTAFEAGQRTFPQEVKDVIGLLRVAVCPNCDGSGCLAVPVMRHTGENDNMGWPVGIIDC